MKRVWNYAISMWQPLGGLLVGIFLTAFLFMYRLGSLAPGIGQPELKTRADTASFLSISKNPINAPYKITEYILSKTHNGIAFERLASSLLAGCAVILFYLLARHLTNRYAAILGTLMFATSSALLHNGRIATPGITVILLLFLLAGGYRLRFSKHRTRSWLIAALAVGLALYTPGMLYFIVIGAVWQFRLIKSHKNLPKLPVALIAAAILGLMLTPLILGLSHEPSLWKDYLLIPRIFPHFKNFILQLIAVPAGVFAVAPKNPLYRLGRQPVLDFFAAAMFIAGICTLIKRYKLDRLPLFAGIFLVGSVLTALSGNYEYSFILVPFIYLTIAIGISMLLESWRKTFPYNPLARSLSLIVVAIAVALSCNFQLRRYFVAWPHNNETRAALLQK